MNSAGAPLRPMLFRDFYDPIHSAAAPAEHHENAARPQIGCSWDRKQTFATIAPYTLEETYEVLDAIERQDYADLRDELGDLLFQVVFYAQMGQEQGCSISMRCAPPSATSWSAVTAHLRRRRGRRQRSRGGALGELKAGERAEKALHSVLDDIPQALPALMKAHKIQKRCASVGFDWNTPARCWTKCTKRSTK